VTGLFWQFCAIIGLISLISCVAVVVGCVWCFVLEPRLHARRVAREVQRGVRYLPPQRPYRHPRPRAS
jgi:hypothetical protein